MQTKIDDIVGKCINCGKFVNLDEAFYTREHPDCDISYIVECCNKKCADEHEAKYFKKDAEKWTN